MNDHERIEAGLSRITENLRVIAAQRAWLDDLLAPLRGQADLRLVGQSAVVAEPVRDSRPLASVLTLRAAPERAGRLDFIRYQEEGGTANWATWWERYGADY